MSERIEAARPEHKPAADHGGMSGSMGIGALQPERGRSTDWAAPVPALSVDLFDPHKHYETIAAWWTTQKWPVVPLTHLSQTGLVVSLNGMPAAAAWIYKTDSAICWLEFIVASPEVRRDARASALSALISGAKVLAKVMGFQTVFMTTKHTSLCKRVEAHGFKVADHGNTNFMYELTGGGQ